MGYICVFVLATLLCSVTCSYTCLCNYHVELNILAQDLSTTIGYMYEFDCKEVIQAKTPDSTWIAVAYEHQIGFVEKDSQVQIQSCPGEPLPDDVGMSYSSDECRAIECIHSPCQVTTTLGPPTALPIVRSTTSMLTVTPKTTLMFTTNIPSTETMMSTIQTNTEYITTIPPLTTLPNTFSSSSTISKSTFKASPTTPTIHSSTTTTSVTSTATTPTTTQPSITRPVTTKPTTTILIATKPTTQISTTELTTLNITLKPIATIISQHTQEHTSVTHTRSTSTPMPTTENPVTPMQTTAKPETPMPTTTSPVTSMPTTAKPATSMSTIAKTASVTPMISGLLCPPSVQQYSKDNGSIITQHVDSCYEIVTQRATWIQAEIACHRKGGHLVHIANAAEQTFIDDFLNSSFRHSVWIGFHDRNNEGTFQWASGDPVTYTNWSPNSRNKHTANQDCVTLIPAQHGQWDDKTCDSAHSDNHYYICQYRTMNPVVHLGTTSLPPQTPQAEENIHLCPMNVKHHAAVNGGILGQYQQWCYELLPLYKYSWQHGEDICSQLGGHLAHISSSQEQSFIQSFVNVHLHDHAVWIGLNDRQTEGHYHWTAGDSVQYTHWVPGHTDSNVNNPGDDCVVLIPNKNGEWYAIQCGLQDTHGGNTGETHPILCQYKIFANGGSNLVG